MARAPAGRTIKDQAPGVWRIFECFRAWAVGFGGLGFRVYDLGPGFRLGFGLLHL